MSISDGDPVRSSEPKAEVPPLDKEKRQDDEVARPAQPSMAWTWAAILAAAVATGFVVWALGEWALTAFAPSYKLTPEQQENIMLRSAEIARQGRSSVVHAAMFTYGSFGAALGLTLGMAGGLAGRSRSRGLAAALAGLILGAGVVAAAASVAVPYYYRAFKASGDNLAHDLATPLIVHGAMWICAGAVGGGALGFGLGSPALAIRGAIGGALGALVATVIYEFLSAMLFPLVETTRPISEASGARLLALLSVAILASLGAYRTAGSPDRVPARLRENP
jgi:hypothetical protein